MAVHECPLCGASCSCHGAGRWGDSDSDRCFHACDPESLDDDDIDGEPVGSCDDCGTNLYGDEAYEGLCDQCSWARSQS